jgi:hypothetical protein
MYKTPDDSLKGKFGAPQSQERHTWLVLDQSGDTEATKPVRDCIVTIYSSLSTRAAHINYSSIKSSSPPRLNAQARVESISIRFPDLLKHPAEFWSANATLAIAREIDDRGVRYEPVPVYTMSALTGFLSIASNSSRTTREGAHESRKRT